MPVYSEMEITFTTDFVSGDTLKITTDNFQSVWTWVASRSASFQVSSAILGGVTGASTATQYETAFDLDKASGYVTTRVDNVLTIQSETEGEDFLGIKGSNTNYGAFTVTFNNIVTPPDLTTIAQALTRSPYYVTTPFNFVTTTKATMSLYVWDGDLTVVPATVSYTVTKIRPTSDYAEFNTDISKLIRESFDVKPVLDITTSPKIVDSLDDNVKWVKYTVAYTDPSEIIPDIEGTLSALDGYGYMQQGVNPGVPTSDALTTATMRKVSRDGFIIFPYINNGHITSIDIDSDLGTINSTLTMVTSNESTDFVQYVCVDVSDATTDEYVTITTKPDNDAFVYEVIDECKYSPMQVVFKNKYGVYDSLTMFKKRVDKMTVSNDTFKNNYISSGTYDITRHQKQKINLVAYEKATLNSGFISAIENELYKEMLLSDRVYFYENSSFVPVNVESKEIEYKTRVNDRLIKYSIDFEYAFNTINNI
jgi:hypothetical protein